jgi:hypothetical protein
MEVGVKKLVIGVVVAIFGSGLWAMGCGSSSADGIAGPGAGGSAGSGGSTTGGGGTSGGSCTLKLVGESCTGNTECCTSSCDPQAKVCSRIVGACRTPGDACSVPQDCCTFVCNGGTCGATQCTSDTQACSSAAQCCSGNCGATGTCTPLNGTCRTTGNSCTGNAECCSKLCNNGACASGGSFCTQTGDACASDAECCGGLCNKVQGATVGVCRTPGAPGTTGCTVAGDVCGGIAGDGGVALNDAGVPSCGGSCCSRACAPFKSGVLICQPPSGCRPTGEVCRTDADCCGFGGVQGSTGVGNCSKALPSDAVGRCDNGNACRPAGAICKLATMSCNAENNCCAGNVNQNPYVCQQDILGIPRCTIKGESCGDGGSKSGQACATSADCCGLPCVPNPSFTADSGLAAFVCGGICAGTGGSCTTAADCCPGLPCVTVPGSTRGTCGGPPMGDGGIVTPPPDAYVPPPGCAVYGQVCTVSSDCCNGVPCTGGRCVIVVN